VEGYLFPDADGKRKIDQHLALGVSLGGHSVWQLMFADSRVTAGVVVIGCPDYMSKWRVFPALPEMSASDIIADLLSDRARLSRLSTYSAQDAGASFLGSRDFPPSLVGACKKFDPKAIFLGTSAVPEARATGTADEAAKQILRDRLRGKKFLLCSGGDDKLVPYRCSEPFLQWFKQATATWYAEEGVSVDDRIYPGVGHEFSADMVADAVQFVLDVVGSADRAPSSSGNDEQPVSKI
jgi:pimeloyl-ACP methyl ester carboxylesterase